MGQRFWALMKRRAERSPATMGLPHFGVRFLHSAPTVEMTGVWGSVWGNLSPGNDCMLPAGIVISSGGTRRYGWQGLWTLMKRRAERSPATMGLPHFGVRFLHSAPTVEMTGGGVISVLFMHFFTAPFSGSAHDSLSSPGGRLSGGYVSSWLSGRNFRHFFLFMSQPVGKELQHAVKA